MERLKSKLISNIKISQKSESKIDLSLADIPLSLHLQGEILPRQKTFLFNYFKDFVRSNEQMSQLNIYYRPYTDEFKNPLHPAWMEGYEDFRIIRQGDWLSISQRDFVALFDSGKHELYVQGPDFSTGAIDSLDNPLIVSMSYVLPQHQALALHASCVEYEDKAYVFFGPSGAGKSTLATQSYYLENNRVLSGDQIYLKCVGDKTYAYPNSTTIPDFPRNHAGYCSKPLEVQGIFYLYQSGTGFSLQRPTQLEFLKLFLKQVIYRKEFPNNQNILTIANDLLEKIPTKANFSFQKAKPFWNELIEKIN